MLTNIQEPSTAIAESFWCSFSATHPSILVSVPSLEINGFDADRTSKHCCHKLPSLRDQDNNILLLLVWSPNCTGQALRALHDWVKSPHGKAICQKLLQHFELSRAPAEIGLLLLAFLSLQRLYPYEPDACSSSGENHLEHFHSFLNGHRCSDTQTTTHMIHSFQRIVVINMDEDQEILQLLVNVPDTDEPTLRIFDTLLDLYWRSRRVLARDHHEALSALPAILDCFKSSAMSIWRKSSKISLPSKFDADSDNSTTIVRVICQYGCTFLNCNEVFEGKIEWKRHENSQHYHNETWRCREFDGNSKIKQCAKLSWDEAAFQQHLRDHGINNMEYLEKESRTSRLGRNVSVRFWCGFCKSTKPLLKTGLEAWDERFYHLDHHYRIEKKNIKDWMPINGHGSKREQEALDARAMFNDQGDSCRVRKPSSLFDIKESVEILMSSYSRCAHHRFCWLIPIYLNLPSSLFRCL